MSRRTRPVGQPTRGKTAPNRLRRLDQWLSEAEAGLLGRRDGAFARALVIDLGFGRAPLTTAEWAGRLWARWPDLPVLGTEIDRERVQAATDFAVSDGPGTLEFRHGGFEVPVRPGESVRLIRAMNVLRQYDQDQVADAWSRMASVVLPGGLIVEGTADPFGRTLVVNLLRVGEGGTVTIEGVLFSMHLRHVHDPEALRAVLPKNLIHRVVPGEPVHALFQTWAETTATAQAWRTFGPREVWVRSGAMLAELLPETRTPRRLLRRGLLLWRPTPDHAVAPPAR